MSRKKRNGLLDSWKNIYEKDYKKLFLIPILLLIFACLQIGYQVTTTGDFINKGVSLKGGLSMSVQTTENVDFDGLKQALESQLPGVDIDSRVVSSAGKQTGIIVEADIDVENSDSVTKFQEVVGSYLNIELDSSNSNLEAIGSNIGDSFFKDTIKAVLIAFVLMGIVVFAYFRTFAPSSAVILAALSDIVVTIAVVNLLGIKLSTAGIAAFLMMIGYSVDTDILLSVRVLKKKTGTAMERIYEAMKTGLTMNVTTMVALTVGLIVSESEIIKQIMIILLIGLFVDIINTWIQNVGILRMYLEKRK